MSEEANLKREEVVMQRFTWNDNEHHCAAGNLLCAITVLTESQKPDNYIEDNQISDYLKSKGLITQTDEHKFHVTDGKHDELVDLGNKISDAIGKELEALPVNTEITLGPAIRLMPVKLPCQTPDVEPASDIPSEMNALNFKYKK